MQTEMLGATRSINKEFIQPPMKRRSARRRSLHLPLALERKELAANCGTLSIIELRQAVAAMLG